MWRLSYYVLREHSLFGLIYLVTYLMGSAKEISGKRIQEYSQIV